MSHLLNSQLNKLVTNEIFKHKIRLLFKDTHLSPPPSHHPLQRIKVLDSAHNPLLLSPHQAEIDTYPINKFSPLLPFSLLPYLIKCISDHSFSFFQNCPIRAELMLSLSQLRNTSINSMQKIVNKQLKEYALNYLTTIQESQSKIDYLTINHII